MNLHVNTADLKAIAKKLGDQAWSSYSQDPSAADALPVATDAAANLKQNAQTLEGFQDVAEGQCKYLSQTFSDVAGAYEQVDQSEAGRIANSAERASAVEAIPVPAASKQLPAIPDGPSLNAVDSGDTFKPVLDTQAALTSGDGGSSLKAAASTYRMRGQLVGSHAEEQYPRGWEGDAAEAAYTRLNEYSTWLRDLQGAWERLESAATKLAEAHSTAAGEHGIVALEYALVQKAAQQLIAEKNPANNDAIQKCYDAMADLQKQSDKIREEYASGATFDAVKPADPPFGSRGGGPSGTPAPGSGSQGGSGSSGGGQGGSPGGSTGSTGSMSPQNGSQPSASPASSGGTGSGAGSSGSGSGGGSPSGGSPSAGGEGSTGGMPSGLTGADMPSLPDDDPSLHPASAGGGGSGGGGGGVPASPLQANLGQSSVGPGPASGGVAGGSGGPAGGAAGGGMGGMGGGMGGGHGQGGGGKEKKRNPALTPDEDIYSEERPWTEPVIGNRRRREVADTPKDSK